MIQNHIGKSVTVVIDRPLNSVHPKFKTLKYLLNYGYIENTVSGDGEELDAYVLGVNEPLRLFEGECIAYISREDGDDKLIVAPHGLTYSDREILELTNFQEKYFKSRLVR